MAGKGVWTRSGRLISHASSLHSLAFRALSSWCYSRARRSPSFGSATLPQALWERTGWHLLFTLAGFPLLGWADRLCLLKIRGQASHYGLLGFYEGPVACLSN